jgi:hypothetical protein
MEVELQKESINFGKIFFLKNSFEVEQIYMLKPTKHHNLYSKINKSGKCVDTGKVTVAHFQNFDIFQI